MSESDDKHEWCSECGRYKFGPACLACLRNEIVERDKTLDMIRGILSREHANVEELREAIKAELLP